MTDDQQRTREQFEAWATAEGYCVSRLNGHNYLDVAVHAAWDAWQAALRAAPEYSDLMNLAATFETCIPFLPATGKKNIKKAVAELRAIAGLPHVSSDD